MYVLWRNVVSISGSESVRQISILQYMSSISVPDTVTVLPRTFDLTHVIQVHLKRKLEYSHNFMTETIRPARFIQAVRYLVNTELYRKHNISFDGAAPSVSICE